MSEIQALLERQALWQKTRGALSWPETIRMAEGVRESVLELRRPQKAAPSPIAPVDPQKSYRETRER